MRPHQDFTGARDVESGGGVLLFERPVFESAQFENESAQFEHRASKRKPRSERELRAGRGRQTRPMFSHRRVRITHQIAVQRTADPASILML